MQKVIFVLFFFTLLLNSCKNKVENVNSFYIWNSELELNQEDYNFFLKNNIENLYIRFFDVTWEIKPKPISSLRFTGNIPANYKIIPVVYIENKVFKNINEYEIEEFSGNLTKKIMSMNSEFFSKNQLKEIQIDCDWTESTRDKYFLFLENFKNKTDKDIKISTTIRLHQIKYKQSAGIPPVDKGVLMYYNIGQLQNYDEQNSIINNDIGKQYINQKSKYPLELSLALPVFSWSVWFNWKGFANVIYEINSNSVDTLDYLEKMTGNKYKITKDTVVEENYLRIGDEIRVEYSTNEILIEAKDICKPLFKGKYEIILYNYKTKNTFNDYDLEKIFNNN